MHISASAVRFTIVSFLASLIVLIAPAHIDAQSANVAAAPTCTISYSPTSISSGNLSVVWSSTGATSRSYTLSRDGVLFFGPASTAMSGSTSVAYKELTSGRLTRVDTVTGPGGSATCSTAVTVVPTLAIKGSKHVYVFGDTDYRVDPGVSLRANYAHLPIGATVKLINTNGHPIPLWNGARVDEGLTVTSSMSGSGEFGMYLPKDLETSVYLLRAVDASGASIVDSDTFRVSSYPTVASLGATIVPLQSAVTVQKSLQEKPARDRINFSYSNLLPGAYIVVVRCDPSISTTDHCMTAPFVNSVEVAAGGSGTASLEIYGNVNPKSYLWGESDMKSGQYYLRVMYSSVYRRKIIDSAPISITFTELDPVKSRTAVVNGSTGNLTCSLTSPHAASVQVTLSGPVNFWIQLAMHKAGHAAYDTLPGTHVPNPSGTASMTVPTEAGIYEIRTYRREFNLVTEQHEYTPMGVCSFTVTGNTPSEPIEEVDQTMPTTSTTPTSAGYCPALSRDFERDATDASASGQVTELQKFLAGYYGVSAQTLVVGTFGPTTQSYVTRFQTEQGLTSTGYVGALTRAAIARVCSGTPSTTQPAPTPGTPSADGSTAAATPTVAAPTCTINYTPSSISSGNLGVEWSSTGATSRTYTLSRNGAVFYGPASAALSGTATAAYTDLTLGKLTRVDTVTGPGGAAQCTTSVSVEVPPVTPPISVPPEDSQGNATTATQPIQPTVAAPTCSIVYSPTSVGSGGTFTATWSSTNATSRSYTVARDGVQFFGPQTSSLNGAGSYTYADAGGVAGTLVRTDTVTGPGGTAKCTASIKVAAPSTPVSPTVAAPTCTISYSPSTISSGNLSVAWSATNATSRTYTLSRNGAVFYGPASAALSGTATAAYADLALGKLTRVDTVTGPGGTAQCTASVTVDAVTVAPSTSTTAPSATTVAPTTTTTAPSTTTTAPSTTTTAPTTSVTPTTSTTAPTTTTEPTQTIAAPSCTISYSASSISGGQLGISWGSSNATSRTYSITQNGAHMYGPASIATSGTAADAYENLPRGNLVRTDTVTGPGGTAQCSTSLTVLPPPAPTCTISYTPSSISSGNLAVSWSSSNATSRTYMLTKNGAYYFGPENASLAGSLSVPHADLFAQVGVGALVRTDTVTGSGGSAECTATVNVASPTSSTGFVPQSQVASILAALQNILLSLQVLAR